MAALFNALKIIDKPIEELRVLMVGLGAAGVAVTKMMLAAGLTHVIGCDRKGALSTTREDYESGDMTGIKRWYAENSNPDHLLGTPDDMIEGMDVFVGLSGPGIIQPESLGKMNRDPIVFAMSNPDPEVIARGSRQVRADHGHRPFRLSRTRSTTCSASPESSGEPWTPARPRSPKR